MVFWCVVSIYSPRSTECSLFSEWKQVFLFAVEQSIGVSNFPRFLEMCHQKVNCAIPIQRIVQKNRAGGFNQLSVPNKVVHQYEDVVVSVDMCVF